uniref:PH domain-containing protein n=1 Tax=Chromera velia CCMP2878 TaxID=1169474 RepID=A0A0G4HPK5_9ALVE|mmetsp:Transcript_13623/g.27065  ORF Transcript_13623/g.27065 Transcript_13623/m.27065 type:complete len:958 (-) Transcript_13623:103-2976(-)|eukprot:Cvel_7820.t1-p1 / transcript=Cvel_7820.t1 / gene=Cvel_7820 / organism=Chromera_velia_CCMP2878 / gene_product=Oxysterol-binding protein-related protein 1, putative / transcript_product=Oxysterol-binding protein-related protein 1, putative / location=Cvel_scaffold417:59751-69557(-) / protein_length=957 / sequence_SO=supercontig / SO=protein_coding / is_pseudo=false
MRRHSGQAPSSRRGSVGSGSGRASDAGAGDQQGNERGPVHFEGPLRKYKGMAFGYRPQYFACEGDFLCYYRSEKKMGPPYKKIALSDIELIPCQAHPLEFELKLANGSKWCLKAESSDVKRQWLTTLKKVLHPSGQTQRDAQLQHATETEGDNDDDAELDKLDVKQLNEDLRKALNKIFERLGAHGESLTAAVDHISGTPRESEKLTPPASSVRRLLPRRERGGSQGENLNVDAQAESGSGSGSHRDRTLTESQAVREHLRQDLQKQEDLQNEAHRLVEDHLKKLDKWVLWQKERKKELEKQIRTLAIQHNKLEKSAVRRTRTGGTTSPQQTDLVPRHAPGGSSGSPPLPPAAAAASSGFRGASEEWEVPAERRDGSPPPRLPGTETRIKKPGEGLAVLPHGSDEDVDEDDEDDFMSVEEDSGTEGENGEVRRRRTVTENTRLVYPAHKEKKEEITGSGAATASANTSSSSSAHAAKPSEAQGAGAVAALPSAETGDGHGAGEMVSSGRGYKRRTKLPFTRTEFKLSVWSVLKDSIGKDLSRISMPVYFNEPTSFLQRFAEDLQYTEVLHQATSLDSSVDRLLRVAVFALTPLNSSVGRLVKPFNPLLGETYEMTHRGFRLISEQVGHHPPVSAYCAESDDSKWKVWGYLNLKNKFYGKSLEVIPEGVIHCELPQYKDRFTWFRGHTLIHNIIIGRLWLEWTGVVVVKNHSTGDVAAFELLRKGWWDKTMHNVRGFVADSTGKVHWRIGGRWSESIWAEPVGPLSGALPSLEKSMASLRESVGTGLEKDSRWGGVGLPEGVQLSAAEWAAVLEAAAVGERMELWRPEALPEGAEMFYNFSQFAMELNEIAPEYDPQKGAPMPPTDSRFRPDQRAWEEGDVDAAKLHKTRLEEKQRKAAKLRKGGEDAYHPRWFRKAPDPVTGKQGFIPQGDYWAAKRSRDFRLCPDIFGQDTEEAGG